MGYEKDRQIQEWDYVPTQILTEYFRHQYKLPDDGRLDGMVYPSAQRKRGCSVVIFASQDDSSPRRLFPLGESDPTYRRGFRGGCTFKTRYLLSPRSQPAGRRSGVYSQLSMARITDRKYHLRNPLIGLASVFLGAGSLLLSCGSGGAGGGDPAFEPDVENCGGFTVDAAAAVFNVPAAGWRDDSQPLGENSRWCIFNSSENSELGLNFSISRADSVDEAKIEFQQFRGNVGTAVSILGEEGQKPHDVPGLGDEALWTPVPGSLHARKGRYSVQVNRPSDEETQIRIMRKILREE